jgi:FIST N domain./FIST C domain.
MDRLLTGGDLMKVATGYSNADSVAYVMEEACRDLPDFPQLIIFFSDSGKFAELSREIHVRYPETTVIGASTFGSFSKHGFCRSGLNIAALSDGIRVSAGLMREITRNTGNLYRDEILGALDKIGLDDCSEENTCCFVLNPAGTSCEEIVLDTLMKTLRNLNIPVVGGSSSSEVCLYGEVSLNGSVFLNSSIYTMIHLDKGVINIALENIFRPMGREYLVTKADPEKRILYELDGEPAYDILCRDLNVSGEGLNAALAKHPFGRIPKGNLFINEIEKINDDRSISTYCRILDQSRLVLLEPCELTPTMDKTWTEIHEKMSSIDFSIVINCYSRTQMYLNNGWMEEFTGRMNREMGPYEGFTTHGELLGDFLLNLSLLVISFGEVR